MPVPSFPHIRGRADDQQIRMPDDIVILAVVLDRGEQAAHGLQTSALLIVAPDHGPGRLGRVGPVKHRDLSRGVGLPFVQQGDIGRAELPLPHGVDLADGEPGVLLAGVTENQNFVSETPSSASSRSNWGTCLRKVSYCSSVQKPMTFSTPARLYHERSNRTTSPAVGRCEI